MNQMNRWAGALLMAVVAIGVGFAAYNLGLSHGLAQSGQVAVAPQGTPPMVVYPYGWYRPWGFGFGFFFPFLFIGLWFLIVRGLFWGRPWRHHYWQHRGPHQIPSAFDEWHRRAHEQMKSEPS